MKRFSRLWRAHWPAILFSCALVAGLSLLLFFRLGSLTPTLSATEVQQQQFSSSWHHLINNPLYLPLHLLQWLILTIVPHHGNTVTRLASIGFGLATLLAFAYVLRRWYGLRTAVYGTALFACSAWFLHVSRYGSTDILYLWAVPTLLAVLILWERLSDRLAFSVLVVATIAMIVYVPGMLWLVALAIGLRPQPLYDALKQLPHWQRLSLIGLFLLLMLPLLYALAKHPSLIQTWIGLPAHFDTAIPIIKRLGLSITYLVYRGPYEPTLWLDRVPVLGVFSVVMTILGVIFYGQHITAPRTRLLAGLFGVGAVLFALHGPVGYSVIVPIVFLVATSGIGYFLHLWMHVFPRNPLARSIGYTLLAFTLLLACSYNLRAYFIAWPHNPNTQAVFARR